MTGAPIPQIRQLERLCHLRAGEYPRRGPHWARLHEHILALAAWARRETSHHRDLDEDRVARACQLEPLFLCGHYKSGTTLVRDLLDGHPSLSVLPGDAKLLLLAQRTIAWAPDARSGELSDHWIGRLINPTGLPPFTLFGQHEQAYAEFVAYLEYFLRNGLRSEADLMSAIARAYYCANPSRSPTARYWVDKTPIQELQLDQLLLLFPDARFVHVVRDPLATLAAMKTSRRERGVRFFLINQLPTFLRSLQQALDTSTHLGEHRYLLIRYEDVIDNVGATMRRLAEYLGLEFSEQLLTPTLNGQPSTSNSAYRCNRVTGRVHKGSLDKWRSVLDREQVEHVTDELYALAIAHGYEWPEPRPTGLRRAHLRLKRRAMWSAQRAWHLARRWMQRLDGRTTPKTPCPLDHP